MSTVRFTLFLSIAAVIISVWAAVSSSQRETGREATSPQALSGLVEAIDAKGKIVAGYGVFPPYSGEDPTTGNVSGVSVDIVNEIGRQLGVEVEWRRFNWSTMAADLRRGDIDLLADAVFQTPARGREMTFTEPYAYFAIGIGIVRKGDKRFKEFDELNDRAVTVAVGQGFAEETFVKARVPNSTLLSIPSNQDTAAPVNAVLTGRADIAIINLEDARRVIAANPEGVELRWIDNPPAYVPAGFAVRFGDQNGANFLNVSLRNLRATGVIQAISEKHHASAKFTEPLTK
jgi:ABC-type amino acid transport substrate-binding protein